MWDQSLAISLYGTSDLRDCTVIVMPFQLVRERYLTTKAERSPFVQRANLFQDVVIRCVRYAFADIPASIGKVFFSKWVALPFLRFRMLRQGFLTSPIHWEEVNEKSHKAIFAIHDEAKKPDIVIYYCHGGGFSMGSAYFYLELLLTWISQLKEAGFENPAVYALEYTLVPEAAYPTQIQEALSGYKRVLSLVDDSSRICISGDSAGATIALSLLLCLSDYSSLKKQLPGLAVLISPWISVISPMNQNTASDYLNAESLHQYGSQYIGKNGSPKDALVSPGQCEDLSWWRRASPAQGWFFIYGAEEVFAPETRELTAKLKKVGAAVDAYEEPGWIHAWPVVKMFLCNEETERRSGVKSIVDTISKRMGSAKRA